ncbi:Hypothetical_protein [Hexamita inflata]|uniref:Hypothetical_protein n=1 Tax=Hexamita inflata TaxID=28002 RepID=A0ABP1HR39_9EUKA
MKIDVTLLAGCWNSVNFENCVFSGQVDNSLFQAQTVNLKITEINYRNNLENLEKLSCAWFYLSQAERDEDCHQVYTDLAMSNEQNQKSNLYVEFCNSTINLCSMSAIWHNITFINCKLIGNHANIFNSTFDGTQLHILCFEQCLNFDLNPLIGLQVQILNLKFENILIDFKLLQECKPQYLTLMKYQQLDVEDLFGTWNNLQIQQSNFINTNTNKLIIATQLILIDMSNLDLAYKYFISQKVKIRKTKTITSYPNACELAVTCSSLNITQANDTITHLSLNEVVLVRFSVLQLRSLESFNINTARDDPSHKTKECILSFLRHKKKNARRIQNLETRIINEQKRINVKTIRVERLKNCFNDCQVLQRICQDNE